MLLYFRPATDIGQHHFDKQLRSTLEFTLTILNLMNERRTTIYNPPFGFPCALQHDVGGDVRRKVRASSDHVTCPTPYLQATVGTEYLTEKDRQVRSTSVEVHPPAI